MVEMARRNYCAKIKRGGVKTFPHSAATVVFLKLASCHCRAPKLPFLHAQLLLHSRHGQEKFLHQCRHGRSKKANMTAATQDFESPTVGKWDCSKFVEKDL
jgi:hypothetical protein